ncbi:MAG TPA: lysylphosphatidylglycerol synthase transmembrane domain-containing protein [Humidesulfovibrio sp.]|uniref:lysylphosphatidylglycerol synthase transmembrane domain-containing protein n=1 Tax=Humidesulfovibrio sp. TaxID=2910988 RepID=UPI002CC3106C|nr:lysylphosphatidylglycerol synthase transmembrane domain-containing protein [Humidesulfovibrio sp.]HWR03897.1 lysylphosphatidylglycerol synthase transmembrane domain-containing protein [Humidesulfovibrio sp.]
MTENATPTATAAASPATQTKGGKQARRALLFAVQALLSVVLVSMVARGLNWQSLGQMASRLSAGFFIGASILSMLTTVLFTMRWQQVLISMGRHPRLSGLVRQNFVGVFFNNFAPSMLGQDAAKTYYLGRDMGYVAAGVSVLVDKILGLGGMTILGAVLIPLLGLGGPLFTAGFTAALFFTLACALALLSMRLPLERLIPSFILRWPLGQRIVDLASRSRADAGSAVTLRSLTASLLVIIVCMGLMALTYAWFLTEATGSAPGIIQLVCALCLMNTMANMPVSVNGIGVREQAHALVLAGLGVPLEAAVGLSLLQYVFMTLQSLIGWGLWVTRPRQAPPEATQP